MYFYLLTFLSSIVRYGAKTQVFYSLNMFKDVTIKEPEPEPECLKTKIKDNQVSRMIADQPVFAGS